MESFEHGGNIHKAMRNSCAQVIDFSANINPLGSPEWLRALVSCELEKAAHYPDPEYSLLRQKVAQFHGITAAQVVVGNGTSELLYFFMQAMARNGRTRLLLPVPSYIDYRRAAELAGIAIAPFPLYEKRGFLPDFDMLESSLQENDLLVLARPNNPTGSLPEREKIMQLAANRPDIILLLDEAFLDFCEGEEKSLGCTLPNIFSLNSMTKFYGVPGLRIGYGIFSEDIAAGMRRLLPPWSVNSLAERFAREALADTAYQQESRKYCTALRQDLLAQLKAFSSLTVFPGVANFLLLKVAGSGENLADFCEKRGVLIRRCDNYEGLAEKEHFFRIAVRTEEENRLLLELFREFFEGKKSNHRTRKKAKTIMFQGTCSDAGKSILTAGLCRILLQDGVAVAPFKAQNMSLNSFVTLQGDEMGRAQVVQAQAARLDPECRMNPVLLKPNSDTGSQVIVCGKPVGNMGVMQYNAYKPKIWPQVCNCFDSLAAEFDVVILEGAGSPGEINLKRDDIVNMRMAQYAKASVLLVGDIDRGGVYASFIGIMETLAEWERRLVTGFVVNKFRGQASLLQSAHDYILRYTGKPVLGVVPWLVDLGLPEEDSVSFKRGSFNRDLADEQGGGRKQADQVEIAVISLPHISNFTDIEPFLDEPDVLLRVVDTVKDLKTPDAVILAGSKNVLHDLQFLHDNGFADVLKKLHQQGCQIIGICGGYQMLGNAICDPYKLESSLGEVAGLGLLDMVTVIERQKNLLRKKGIHLPSGKEVFGYEIHHGISSGEQYLLKFDDGSCCGLAGSGVWGSYLHGIFDSDEFRRYYIDLLRQKKGLVPLGRVVAPYDLEAAFDRLADCLRENMDMDSIYQLLGL